MATFCPADIFSSKILAFCSALNFSMIFLNKKRCLLLTSFKIIAVPTFYSVIEAEKLVFNYLKATPMLYVKSGLLQSLRLLHVVNFMWARGNSKPVSEVVFATFVFFATN